MKNKKNTIPKFESEEQEAEYWDNHSPLDLVAEPEAQKVRVMNCQDSVERTLLATLGELKKIKRLLKDKK